eukprot:CAMPEP_0181347056 /NCGR_PEP_ID=MMETSP1101-20121128/33672_1 /TAXON_ID=46948 /ORGANISM="Rhodomonas abbreviata, Strain Caron Lab Isolate" /LENGTH=185 /DNA_ID=CAMNT_0023459239 /DNA_START=528 /DNA_END=1085 /DNA_ORIENTATION=+
MVLAVVDGGDDVVLVVCLGVEHPRDHHVIPRVVEGGEDSPDHDERDRCLHVHGEEEGDEVDGKEVVVLAEDVLEGVHVDGVVGAPARRVLLVVVLVDVPVDLPKVEDAMKDRVEQIVHHKERNEGAHCAQQCDVLCGPHDARGLPAEADDVVGEEGGRELVPPDEAQILRRECVQMLSPDWDAGA